MTHDGNQTVETEPIVLCTV